MVLSKKQVSIILPLIIFGGIIIAMILGYWQTTTLKIPVKFKDGEFAGSYNPQDIRGSYDMKSVSDLFDIPLEDLQGAFNIPDSEINSAKCKDLSAYSQSDYEVGPKTVRLFVAMYKGLPIDLDDTVYFSEDAATIIKTNGTPTSEQLSFLESHTYTG